jgi:hypothetical protein
MTINQVITLAKKGELKNLAQAANDTETIVAYINLGLLELYKRFPLSIKEHLITLSDDTEIYDMPRDFMWIVAAYGEVAADDTQIVNQLPINEEDNPLSVNTVSYNQVQIPVNVEGEHISLIYVASPPYILYDADTETFSYVDIEGDEQTIVDVPLPAQMIEALLHYIGYRAHGSLTGELNAEHTTHYVRFEASCTRVEQRGMFTNDDMSTVDKFKSKLWV